jgi:alkaline phosphatase D
VLAQNAGRMRHLNLIDQGYLLVDVTPEDVTVQVRLVNTYDPNARPFTGAAFRIRKGATRMERLPVERRRGSSA